MDTTTTTLDSLLARAISRAADTKTATAKLRVSVAQAAMPICHAAYQTGTRAYVTIGEGLQGDDWTPYYLVVETNGSLWIAPENWETKAPASYAYRQSLPAGVLNEGWFVGDDGTDDNGKPTDPAECWKGWKVAPRHALVLVPAALPKLAARLAELVEARATQTESALAAISGQSASA